MACYLVGLCPCQGFPLTAYAPLLALDWLQTRIRQPRLPTPPLQSSPHCARSDAAFHGAGGSLAGSENGLLAESGISHGECRLE